MSVPPRLSAAIAYDLRRTLYDSLPRGGGGKGGGDGGSARRDLRRREQPPPQPSPSLGEGEVQRASSAFRVGIHHSSPRGVVTYSGQRKSSGTRKSLGSRGAIQVLPPIPPPVRWRHS